jgi:hypothetical protein
MIDWNAAYIYRYSGGYSIDFEYGYLIGSSNLNSIDWTSRILYAFDGSTPNLNWANANTVQINGATDTSSALAVDSTAGSKTYAINATGNSLFTGNILLTDTSTYFNYNSGDIDIYIAANKTIELQTSVYKDINIAGVLLSKPTSSAPGTDTFRSTGGTDTTIETYAFAVDEKVHGGFELQHDYKEGTDLVFHVHWQGIAAPTGTDNVQWRLNYIVARDGVTLAAATVFDSPDTAIDTRYRSYRTDFAAITGTNFKIGDQFMFTLTRVASTGDAYAGDALIETAGIHYQIDTLGSRSISTK